jgi:hypothetical protein
MNCGERWDLYIAPSPDLSNAIVHLVEGGRIEFDDGLMLAARYLVARG